MIKEFNSLEEIQKYYNKEINTYLFAENGEYFDLVIFNFDLNVTANIRACDIKACNIEAYDIDAVDIKANDIRASSIRAWNIIADNILYYPICFAYQNIKCKSIKGRHPSGKHFVLDGGKLEVEEENQ